MIVGVNLVQIPIEVIKPLTPRQPRFRCTDIAQSPLANQRCPVTGRLEEPGDRWFSGP
jgi:hypothetical protein